MSADALWDSLGDSLQRLSNALPNSPRSERSARMLKYEIDNLLSMANLLVSMYHNDSPAVPSPHSSSSSPFSRSEDFSLSSSASPVSSLNSSPFGREEFSVPILPPLQSLQSPQKRPRMMEDTLSPLQNFQQVSISRISPRKKSPDTSLPPLRALIPEDYNTSSPFPDLRSSTQLPPTFPHPRASSARVAPTNTGFIPHSHQTGALSSDRSDPASVAPYKTTILPLLSQSEQEKKTHSTTPTQVKECRQCGSRSTPEWRRGPEGPRTLCNACGLRYLKVKKMKEEQVSEEEKHQNAVSLLNSAIQNQHKKK